MFHILQDVNDLNRQTWIANSIRKLPAGARLLDAGAGELRNRVHCEGIDYVSQDFSVYRGGEHEGISGRSWDAGQVDLVSDIASIPAPDASFDAVLCSEVLEHVPEPTRALAEFSRLLKPGGSLILTAPFSSNVHMAPYHFATGFSRYWYEHHLPALGFQILELSPNGDWFSLLRQELSRLGGLERQRGSWMWPLAYVYAALGLLYFRLRPRHSAPDIACFGWHCLAVKEQRHGASNLQIATSGYAARGNTQDR
jgi:SAM-dependent methyltransferase